MSSVQNRRHLSVVSQGEQLSGVAHPDLERLARTASVGSKAHVGLLSILLTLTKEGVRTSIPPSAAKILSEGLSAVGTYQALQASPLPPTEAQMSHAIGQAETARARCFQSVTAIEELTAESVKKAQAHLQKSAPTPLDPHADHVVLRYARNAAHFTVSAVCHLLDAVHSPSLGLEVPRDLEGARAFQLAGLGAARHAAFRAAALDQARFEAARAGHAAQSAATDSLAVQIFHEYLGGRYRAHADTERARQAAFVSWAISGRA